MGCTLCTDLDLVVPDRPHIPSGRAPRSPLEVEREMSNAKKRLISLAVNVSKRASERTSLTNESTKKLDIYTRRSMWKLETASNTDISVDCYDSEEQTPAKLEEAIVEQAPPMYIASKLLGDGAQSKVYKAHV